MKRLSALLALTALFPLAAGAQESPPPPPPGDAPPPAQRAEFKAMHAKMDALHQKFRTDVLSVLTSAQRVLLAQIVGSLAVAPVPDVKGAIERLDSTLSPSQKAAVLQAVKADREAMRPPHGMMHHMHDFKEHHHKAPDAGAVVLNVAMDFGKMHGEPVPWMHQRPGPWMHHGPGDGPHPTPEAQATQ